MNSNRFLLLLAFIVISFVPIFDLFHLGLPLTHDGQDHIARIANFYQNLLEGNLIPRWAGNLNWGYGHPILMFLYPLPSYAASLFHFLGFSYMDSLKIVFGAAFIISGFSMYLWVREFLDEQSGFIAGIIYMFAPYRFVDLYVRGAIGEHVAFVFPPLVCYFLLRLSKKYSYWYVVGGSLSLSGLILSHNAITLMFLPIIFFYIIYLFWQSNLRKYFMLNALYLILSGFAISAFFWMPAFFEGKYTLRDIVTKGTYVSSFVELKDLFFGPWSYGGTGQFTVQIGIIQWLTAALVLPVTVILKKKKNKLWIVCVALFLAFLLSLFLMMPISKLIWAKITIMQKFQFPWRFLSVTVFVTALFGGFLVFILEKRFKTMVALVIVVLLLWLNRDYWHANGYLQKPDSFFAQIYSGTTDTGESAPIWSIRFMEHSAKAPIEVISGNAVIQQKKRIFIQHTYVVFATKSARIRENTLFFPGWFVLVDGRPVSVEFQDPQNRGLMTFFVSEGKHALEIKFSETKLRIVADAVSLLGLVILAFYAILGRISLWLRFRLY